MTAENRLDALLDTLRHDAPPLAIRNGSSAARHLDGDAELAPLLEVARDLAPLASAQPDRAFAATLRTHLLARAAERRADMAALAEMEATELGLADAPTVPLPAVASTTPPQARRRPSLRPLLVAAALLVTLGAAGLGVTWAAMHATPGDPLYGLHQFGQTVQQNTAPDSASRAQLHLTNARQLLAQLRTDAQQTSGTAYASALTAFLQEESAAAQQISQVPAGTQRTALDQSLAALRGDERTTLRTVLPSLGFADQMTTTQVLGSLGVAVPHVTGATVVPSDHGLWTVTLSGSGFEPGATLLVDGHPAGKITALSPTSLTAQVAPGPVRSGSEALGVSNPDGTVAITNAVQTVAAPTPTPGGKGHGNGNGNGNGGQ